MLRILNRNILLDVDITPKNAWAAVLIDIFIQLDVFTQISDLQTNQLVREKFEFYLKEILKLPASVFEEPSFYYDEQTTSKRCFGFDTPVYFDMFLDTLMTYPGPSSFIWLHVLNRIILTQNVVHNIKCSICLRSNFTGFRYKCLTCKNYQMCQDCFWRGRQSGSHLITHESKEYSHYVSVAGLCGHQGHHQPLHESVCFYIEISSQTVFEHVEAFAVLQAEQVKCNTQYKSENQP